MAEDDKDTKSIQIPVWFLKLIGWTVGTFGAGAMLWASWLTMNVIEIRSSVNNSDKNTTKIEQLQKDVNGLRIDLLKRK